MLGMDDGLIRIPPKVPSPPLFAPLARPAALRRALSDYDARARQMPVPPGLPRSSSLEGEDQPKQTPAYPDLHSPMHPSPLGELRGKKSPRLAATIEPMTVPPLDSEAIDRRRPRPAPLTMDLETRPAGVFPDHVGEVELVDEGDVLPPDIDLTMDVTFEDEGLNTLERIFLLSKSEFPFHRAYIARVLGDLLYDVDPCESVEYVLPLISSFTLDEDESVKEAFAADLHRMLWYFFSMCRVIPAGEEPTVPFTTGEDETVTITSEGVNVVHRPSEGEIEHRSRADSGSGAGSGSGSSGSSGSKSARDEVDSANESLDGRRKSVASLGGSLGGGGPSSGGSSFTRPGSSTFSVPEHDVDTPDSIVSSSSQDTVFSPSTHVDPYADTDPDKGWTKDVGPLVQQPTLPVDFFTPLLGALLLNANTDIQDSVRTGIVTLIGRLRGKGDLSAERWGQYAAEADERRVFASQNGPHSHDLRPMSTSQREMVEKELLQGIVVGMGRLSTEMPDHLFSDTLEENQRTLEMYADSLSEELSADIAQAHRDRDAFQAQLIQEATAGRATSMNLIGALCEFYDGVEVVQRGFVDEVLRSGDGDVPVRAEGAVALSYIAKIVPVEHVYRMVRDLTDTLLTQQIPLFEQLADDEYPQVRQSACLSLPAICRRIESPDYRRTFATKALRTLIADSPDGDDDVRCAALEVLGELIYVFHDDPRGPPAELLVAYLDADGVGKGLGEDWDVVASFNVSRVERIASRAARRGDRCLPCTRLWRRSWLILRSCPGLSSHLALPVGTSCVISTSGSTTRPTQKSGEPSQRLCTSCPRSCGRIKSRKTSCRSTLGVWLRTTRSGSSCSSTSRSSSAISPSSSAGRRSSTCAERGVTALWAAGERENGSHCTSPRCSSASARSTASRACWR
jgi:serine/threonine-protein phosphatase 4 regulatory subunit 1